QLLISFQNRKRIDPELGRDMPHRRQRIAFVEQTVENHSHDTIAKLSINWLTIIPFTVHPESRRASLVLYLTITQVHASLFFVVLPVFHSAAHLARSARQDSRQSNKCWRRFDTIEESDHVEHGSRATC